MLLFEGLPPGLWVIKWIDRFHFQHHDSESAAVDVALQLLPFEEPRNVNRLKAAQVAEVLANRHPRSRGLEKEATATIRRILLAGFLPLVRTGDVYEMGRRVARLPADKYEVILTNRTAFSEHKFGERIDLEKAAACGLPRLPPEWPPGAPYKVLNHFEYPAAEEMKWAKDSRCLLFQYGDVEYILPRMVIFQAFYSGDSRLINALCNGHWAERAKEVISFSKYKSGIETVIDSETGDWKIVLAPGLDKSLAPILALLWFDEYARAQTNSLHTDSMLQNGRAGGPEGRGWFASANIPHRFEPEPFRMKVEGYCLRKSLMAQDKGVDRVLITSILASSWSLPDQAVQWEWHNSSEQGEESGLDGGDKGYRGGKPAVEGDPNATGSPNSDPNADRPTNVVQNTSFEYLRPPTLTKQVKRSSQTFPPGSPTKPERDPAADVSAGNPTFGDRVPAPSSIQTPIRAGSQQFDFLVKALGELKAASLIESYEPVAPEQSSGLAMTRNGLPCWSLLKPVSAEKRNKERRIPKRGWEIVRDDITATPGEKRSKFRHARCVLMLRIRVRSRAIILLEIEPRPNASAFCMFTFEDSGTQLGEGHVSMVLKAIRDHEGVFTNDTLQRAFAPLASSAVKALRHAYTYSVQKADNGKEVDTVSGLRADILLKGLLGVLGR
jgi:hypothetical protein